MKLNEIRALSESTINDLDDWLRPISRLQSGLYRFKNDSIEVQPGCHDETVSIEWLAPNGDVCYVQRHVWELQTVSWDGDQDLVANATVDAVRGYLDRVLKMRESKQRIIGERDYYTTSDVATLMGVNIGKVCTWIDRDELRAINTSDGAKPKYRISKTALADFEELRSTKATTPPHRDATIQQFV